MTQLLQDSTVVVTGASSGIGAACVERLQGAGARIIGVDRAASSDADEHLQLDLQSLGVGEAVAAMVADSRLVGLVNSAAASSTVATSAIDEEAFDSLFSTNVRAPFLLSEALLHQLEAEAGSVVNIASVHAFATSPGAVPYAASKGALVSMTRALSVDWATRGFRVRVNAVAPGAVDTPMLRDGLARTGSTLRELESRHLGQRVGRPDEIAALVEFLLGPDSGFINGECIVADGGALARLSTETD